MDFVLDVTDLGAPEFVVKGVASIERISPGLVRITKFTHRRDGNQVTHHEVWDVNEYLAAAHLVSHIMDVVSKTPPEGEERRSDVH